MRRRGRSLVCLLALCALLAGCAKPATQDPTALRPLSVAAVSVEIGVGSPIPVEIVASGDWPDLCAQLAQVTSKIHGTTIEIGLYATAAKADCPPDHVGVPFRIAVPLNPVELPAGTYAINVNGVSASLTWPPQP